MIVAAAAGLVVGLVHFGALRATVARLPRARHPAALVLGSFGARFAFTVAALAVVMDGSAARLAAALVGLLVARTWLLRREAACS